MLGDLIKPYWTHLRSEYLFTHYPRSIVADYARAWQQHPEREDRNNSRKSKEDFKAIVRSDVDLEMLASIIARRHPYVENTTAIHLRIGDVVDLTPNSVAQLLTSHTVNGLHHNPYVKPLRYYDAAPRLGGDGSSGGGGGGGGIVIVAGSHCGARCSSHRKSCAFVNAVAHHIRTRVAPGSSVSLRLGGDPDEDFAFMARSRRFLPAYGGYSTLIARLVERFGGTVLRPPCKNMR